MARLAMRVVRLVALSCLTASWGKRETYSMVEMAAEAEKMKKSPSDCVSRAIKKAQEKWKFPRTFFPNNVLKTDPELLAAGGYSSVWVAEDQETGQEVVIKLLAYREAKRYLKGKDRGNSSTAVKLMLREAKIECDVTMKVHKKGYKKKHHIPVCLGHNIDKAGPEELLYLKMRRAGGVPLFKYRNRKVESGEWDLTILGKILKQVFQVLEMLARLPWVHHDLAPPNILVEDVKGGEPFVHVLDFGSSVSGAKDEWCVQGLGGHQAFMPAEYFFGPKVCKNPHDDDESSEMLRAAYVPGYPQAFDAASAGLIFFRFLFNLIPFDFANLVIKKYVYDAVKDEDSKAVVNTVPREHRVEFGFKIWAFGLGDPEKAEVETDFREAAKELLKTSNHSTAIMEDKYEEFKKPEIAEFLRKAVGLLSNDAQDRPEATELLQTDWMKSLNVPDKIEAPAAL